MRKLACVFMGMWLISLCPPELPAQWIQTNRPDSVTTCFAVVPKVTGGMDLFAGTHGGGVVCSTDNGTSWKPANNGLTCSYVHALYLNGADLYAGTSRGVFLSTDNGAMWVFKGLSNSYVSAIAACPNLSGGKTLFAGSLRYDIPPFISPGGVFRSTDDGSTWTDVSGNSLAGLDVTSLTVAPDGKGGTSMFAGTSPFYLFPFFLPFSGGIYRSDDDGTTWINVSESSISEVDVIALSVAPDGKGGNTVLAATGAVIYFFFPDFGAILGSTNNGTSWTRLLRGPLNTYSLAVTPNERGGSRIFAGTDYGVHVSDDNGASWTGLSYGLTEYGIVALAVNSASDLSGPSLFAATATGAVWRRSLSQIATSVAEVRTSLPREYVLHQNYPNPFNPVTSIRYELPRPSHLRLSVFNALGQEVARLVDGIEGAGENMAQFDASGLSSGTYFCRMFVTDEGEGRSVGVVSTKNMVLLK